MVFMMERVPFNFQFYVHLPERRIYAIHMILDKEAMYKAGLLNRITDFFSIRNIPIIYYAVSMDHISEVHSIIFIDLTDHDDVNMEEITYALKSIPYVLDVKIIKPVFKGFTYDPYFFPLMMSGERAVIFQRRNYLAFNKIAREEIGSGYTMVLFIAGYDMGVEAFKGHVKMVGNDVEKLLKVASALFQISGFGIIEIDEYDLEKGEARVRVYNSFECSEFKEAREPQSHLVRGMLAGWFSGLFKRKTTAVETKCISMGDPYCEFEVKVKEK